jgi:hypothetical protein
LLLELYDENAENALSDALKILFSTQTRSTGPNSLTLESIHQKFMKDFISSLPAETPSQFRARRYEIINTVAVEICLASLRLPFVSESSESSPEPLTKMEESNRSSARVRFQEGASQKFTHESVSDSSSSSSADSVTKPVNILSRYVKITKASKPTPKTLQNLKHWELGQDPDEYNYTDFLVEEQRQAELAELTQEERMRREKAERKKQREQEREAKRFVELSQRMQATQDSIVGSQSELVQQERGTQSRLRQALARRRAEEGDSQSQSQTLAPTQSQLQSGTLGDSQWSRRGFPKSSQLVSIEEREEFTMSGALPIEDAEPQGEDMQMIWEPTQPEATQVPLPPEASQGITVLQQPAFVQATIGASQDGGPSSSQKPPKKKKRVKGF